MKNVLIFSLWLLLSAAATADSIRKIDLQHRDASATQSLLLPLFEGDISMVVDGNSLLVRGNSADLQALADMVTRLDQPKPSLRVSLYRGVDPFGGDIDQTQRRTSSTHLHRDNVQDQWIMEEGTTLTIRDNVRVIDTVEQRLVEQNTQESQSFLTAESSKSKLETNQHEIKLTLSDNQQSVRLALKTQLANRKVNDANNHSESTEVESRRVIPTNQWVRLFYRQAQANHFTPEKNSSATTALNFDNEQALWIWVEALR